MLIVPVISLIFASVSMVPVTVSRTFAARSNSPLRTKIPRRFRQTQRHEPVDEGGDRGDHEHPSPGREPPERLVGRSREVGEQRIGEESREDTGHDRELLQGAKAPAHGGRRDLRDVGGGDDRCRPDAETTITRQTIRSMTPNASPDPIAEMKNIAAATTITGIRPYLLDTGPANQAPTAQR